MIVSVLIDMESFNMTSYQIRPYSGKVFDDFDVMLFEVFRSPYPTGGRVSAMTSKKTLSLT